MNITSRFLKDTGGSVTAMTAIALIAFVGVLAFVIDLGHLHIVQNELRNAADACALRGARAFCPDSVSGLLPAGPGTTTAPDPANAKSQAIITVTENKSDNVALKDLPTGDIQVGIWDYTARQLTSWQWPPPASDWGKMIGPGISLPVKRAGSDNYGPVAMTLASFLGQDLVSVGANATAALSGIGGFVPGSPVLPFGSWDDQVKKTGKDNTLHGTFNRDGTDTLGWTNLDPNNTNPNASELKKLLTDPTGASTPYCPTGSTVGIQNGQVDSAMQAMTKSNNRFGLVETPAGSNVYVPSTAMNPLTSTPGPEVSYADTVYMMPVYIGGSASGDKYNQSAVVGAVPVKIDKVSPKAGNKYIDLVIQGDDPYLAPGYGGGAWYGILATQPFLVE